MNGINCKSFSQVASVKASEDARASLNGVKESQEY